MTHNVYYGSGLVTSAILSSVRSSCFLNNPVSSPTYVWRGQFCGASSNRSMSDGLRSLRLSPYHPSFSFEKTDCSLSGEGVFRPVKEY